MVRALWKLISPINTDPNSKEATVMQIAEVLQELSSERPIFHSEADFQHSLAWKIHEKFLDAKLRLEYPVDIDEAPVGKSRLYLDIWLQLGDTTYGIELKYKTKELDMFNGEHFVLKNQFAVDIGRYDYLKDVERLERLVHNRTLSRGYAILLTNDHLYWELPTKEGTVDKDFRIHNGRTIRANQELKWSENASKGTMKNRESSIILMNHYSLTWNEYSAFTPKKGNRSTTFKVLIVELVMTEQVRGD